MSNRIGQRDIYPSRILNRHIRNGEILNRHIRNGEIESAKIKNLSWDKAQGGTAVLGGTDNVSGILSIHDASDVEKGVLNKDGLTIYSGKITIQNDSDTTSIDAKGIVSSENFVQSASVNLSLNQVVSGASETDITGATLTFTVARSRLILIMFSTSNTLNQSAGNTANFTVRLRVGASDVARTINVNVVVGDGNYHTYSNFYTTTLTAGTYTVKLTGQLETITGAPTATVYDYRLAYFLMGT